MGLMTVRGAVALFLAGTLALANEGLNGSIEEGRSKWCDLRLFDGTQEEAATSWKRYTARKNSDRLVSEVARMQERVWALPPGIEKRGIEQQIREKQERIEQIAEEHRLPRGREFPQWYHRALAQQNLEDLELKRDQAVARGVELKGSIATKMSQIESARQKLRAHEESYQRWRLVVDGRERIVPPSINQQSAALNTELGKLRVQARLLENEVSLNDHYQLELNAAITRINRDLKGGGKDSTPQLEGGIAQTRERLESDLRSAGEEHRVLVGDTREIGLRRIELENKIADLNLQLESLSVYEDFEGR